MAVIESADGESVRINRTVLIPRGELEFRATRSGGPGGQHVNTSSTRVELTWNAGTSAALTDVERTRLFHTLGARVDSAGTIRVVASDTRSQRRNRDLAIERFTALVRRALVVKKARKRSAPSRAAVEARLTEKKRQSGKKRERRTRTDD